MEFLGLQLGGGQLSALLQVVMIDLVMSGDNAIIIGMAVAGLPPANRGKIIFWGVAGATVLRIGFAAVTSQLLQIIGLTLAGGLILLWVCWKMWRELHAHSKSHAPGEVRPAKSFASALTQIMLADLSMSLDNVLAVAGAARDHPALLVFGLLLSIALMGIAASWIARFLGRMRWLGYVGLLVVIYVALSMIWAGHRTVIMDLNLVRQYNAVAPAELEITPQEAAAHRAHKQH